MADNDEEDNVRSIYCDKPAYVKFYNHTNAHVNVYWVDYDGKWRLYHTLRPNCYVDVDTYMTHPWVFQDDHGKRYVVNSKKVFYPIYWKTLCFRGLCPPMHRFRVFVMITSPLLSLTDLAVEKVASLVERPESVHELEIPESLKGKIKQIVIRSLPPNTHEEGLN